MYLGSKPVAQKPERLPPDPEYIGLLKTLPCICCGRSGPSEAHHARDLPDYEERDIYKRLPGAAQKSHDRDALPLCQRHHEMFHLQRSMFHELYGRDYRMLPKVREMMERLTEDDILGDWM